MKHHLTYKDAKSDKFWQIEVNGKLFTVAYGKIGTAGTSHTKEFDSEEKCMKEAEKLLNEKLKKGYNASNKISLERLLDDDNLKNTLCNAISKLEKDMTKQLASYYKSLGEEAEDIGGIFFFWDDSGSNNCFLACHVEGISGKEEVLAEFDGGNEAVIVEDFLSGIFSEHERTEKGWDLLMRLKTEIICPLFKDILKESVSISSFKKLSKVEPFYIFFSAYHDDEGNEELIIELNSSNKVESPDTIISAEFFIMPFYDDRKAPSPVNSPKFWSFEVKGLTLIEKSGKLGEDGSFKQTSFSSIKELKKALKELIFKREGMNYYRLDLSDPEKVKSMEEETAKFQAIKRNIDLKM